MNAAPHILYIEDNEFNQRLIKKILEPLGFPISKALDGIQGIKQAVELKPDLILMDLELPHLDGLGVAAKIKSLPGLEQVPIVALTTKNSNRERERALVAGCDGCIEKPINAVTFPSQVRTYLEGKREEFDTADKTRILKDFSVTLVDQLKDKVEELEQTNRALVKNKEELQTAYTASQNSNIELQRLNRLKENIVTITSHELRTPLSIATGYIDLIMEGLLGDINEDQVRVLQISRQSLQKMVELIDKMTDLTRLDLRKNPMNLEHLDLNKAFETVYEDLAIFMKIRELTLSKELADGPLMVVADKNLMGQVFGNLLKNAICFTPNGGSILVSTWQKAGKAFFGIRDSGIGIKEEDLERIFDEFYQIQEVTHHQSGQFEFLARGIGVGLALCRRILNEIGGKIWAESAGLDRGSTFSFYLPMVKKE